MAIITIKCAGDDGCKADVYVARYEVYPNVDPTGVCVGFRAVLHPSFPEHFIVNMLAIINYLVLSLS